MTQRELADRLNGFRQPDVAKVESLQRRLDLIELVDWLEAFGSVSLEVPELLTLSLLGLGE